MALSPRSLRWSVVALTLLVGACAGEVVDRTGDGHASDGIDGIAPPDEASETGTETAPATSGTDDEPQTHLECSGASGSCTSDEFPVDESCYECSCRCCALVPDEAACQADPACASWLDCLRGCENAEDCGPSCPPPCSTGNEVACYLVDCHNWICSHACGSTF